METYTQSNVQCITGACIASRRREKVAKQLNISL
jgi:hypothetical protein